MPPRRRSSGQGRHRGESAPVEDDVRRVLESSEKIYYRIGEVSRLTGVKAHVLRYWETEFRWMAPPKSRSKQRLYRKRDIELVLLLKRLLWDERYTIAGARQRIQELGVDEALAQHAHSGADPASAVGGGPASDQGAATPAPASEHGPMGAALRELHAELLSLRSLLQDPA